MNECECACHSSGTAFQRPCDVLGGCGHLHDDRRCGFPGCLDPIESKRTGERVPRLLGAGEALFCHGCRARYGNVLRWIRDDYLTIHAAMPTPLGGNGVMVTASKEYGHPAEWASDMKRRLADTVDAIADDLRDHLGHTPANPGRREARKFDTEHRYLTAHLDDLCVFPGAVDAAIELDDLHADIRRALGQTRAATKLDTPCPECDLITMRRTVELDRSDTIECMNCGATVKEEHYGLYTRVVLDALLNDTPEDTPAA